jgi:hypothetical protein
MWRPYDTEYGKVRYGKKGDGGYVIANSSFGAKAIFGYGVDRDVSFENELSSKWNVPAFVFDHTITSKPRTGPNVQFVPEGIAAEDRAPCFTLEKHLKQFGYENSEILLKMDVENCEWDVLRGADLSRVTQLVIEMHEMERAPKDVLHKLFSQFWLIHIHGNNSHCQSSFWVDRVRRMPRYIECTWVRKDLVKAVPSTSAYPTSLDSKNRPDVQDLDLTHLWTPIKAPVSFVAASPCQEEIIKSFMCREDEVVSDVTKARHDWVVRFVEGDVVSVRFLIEIDTLIKESFHSHIDVAVSHRGVVVCEPRIWNRHRNTGVTPVKTHVVQLYSTLGAR